MAVAGRMDETADSPLGSCLERGTGHRRGNAVIFAAQQTAPAENLDGSDDGQIGRHVEIGCRFGT